MGIRCSLHLFWNCKREKTVRATSSEAKCSSCKLLEADHDDQRKYIFYGGQKTEISVSADGDICEMKKTESWQVWRPHLEYCV